MKTRKFLSLALALILCSGLLTVPAGAYDMSRGGDRTVISTGMDYTAVLDENGTLWMWGGNDYGQLGNGTTEDSAVPAKVMDGVAAVSCGSHHAAAIKADGSLWMWGWNIYGQLGNGTTEDSPVPVKIMDHVVAVSCGTLHTAAIQTDGSLWLWGANDYGQLGNGASGFEATSVVPIKVMDNVAAVNCGSLHTAAIQTGGSLWMWGDNGIGQLGNSGGNSTNDEGLPIQTVPIKAMDNVAAVSCGDAYTAAIQTDDSLWMWGHNYYDQLGNGTKESSAVPIQVMDNVAAVSCGKDHTAAIRTDGTLWTWGYNHNGQVGNGAAEPSTPPSMVLDDVAAVSCGAYHTNALKTDGTLWAWGLSLLGDGITEQSSVPIQITLDGAAMPKGVRVYLGGGVGGGTLWTNSAGTIQVPTNPTKEGFTFGGWYTDEALTTPWNFNDAVVNTLVLYAKWVPVSSTAATVGQSSQKVTVDGAVVDIQGYTLIAGNGGEVTYVKLRDIAALLDGTSAQFNVDWRGGAIYVDVGQAYTTRNGTELKAISGTDGSYRWNTAPVLFGGETKALEGIVITDGDGGGHTFFKLRDLGAAIGFTVDWDAQRGIYIETN